MVTMELSSVEWIACRGAREALAAAFDRGLDDREKATHLREVGLAYGAEYQTFLGADGTPYITRYTMVKDRYAIGGPKGGHVFLHHIHRPDMDTVPHDHPWDVSVVRLVGSYMEQAYDPEHSLAPWTTRNRKPGDVYHMDYRQFHRIDRLCAPETWSLVFTGPYSHSWGFFRPGSRESAGRKIPHAQYRPDHVSPTRIGHNCRPSYGR
jgi:hypothetical protein